MQQATRQQKQQCHLQESGDEVGVHRASGDTQMTLEAYCVSEANVLTAYKYVHKAIKRNMEGYTDEDDRDNDQDDEDDEDDGDDEDDEDDEDYEDDGDDGDGGDDEDDENGDMGGCGDAGRRLWHIAVASPPDSIVHDGRVRRRTTSQATLLAMALLQSSLPATWDL